MVGLRSRNSFAQPDSNQQIYELQQQCQEQDKIIKELNSKLQEQDANLEKQLQELEKYKQQNASLSNKLECLESSNHLSFLGQNQALENITKFSNSPARSDSSTFTIVINGIQIKHKVETAVALSSEITDRLIHDASLTKFDFNIQR